MKMEQEEVKGILGYKIFNMFSYTGSVGLANNNNYKNWLEIAVQ